MFEVGDSKLWCFCARVHTLLGKRFFLQDPSVVTAIENNQPKVFADTMNSLIQKAFAKISMKRTKFGKYLSLPKIQCLIQDYGRLMEHITSDSEKQLLLVNKKKLSCHHKVLIIIQLTIWSCSSEVGYTNVAFLLHYFIRAKINLGSDETWSWLYWLTTCVSFNTSLIYDKHATNDEKKYPTCQLLLLPMAIKPHTVNFAAVATKPSNFNPVMCLILSQKLLESIKDPVKAMALTFISYVKGRGTAYPPLLISRIDYTLKFFTEMKTDSWFDVCQKNEAQKMMMISSAHGECKTADAATASSMNQAASVLVSLGRQISEPNQSNHEAFASIRAISSVPLITDKKYKKLVSHLAKMKNQLDTSHIIQLLENQSTMSLTEKSLVYQENCVDFCKRKFALKDCQKPIDQYLIKMIAYSGLLIHDLLRVQHVKNLVDHQNVFAHVLYYCLEGTFDTSGSYKEQNQNIWKNFFLKLLPRSAFSVDRTVSSSRSVASYFRKCVDSMDIIIPNQNQLVYYFQNDYFSMVKYSPSGISNTNNASPAVEAGEEVVVKQTSSSSNKKRQTNENYLTPKKKCRVKNPTKACSSPGEQKNSSTSSNHKPPRPEYKNPSSSSGKTKAFGSPFERENTSSASSNRKSTRTSPPTKFFSPE